MYRRSAVIRSLPIVLAAVGLIASASLIQASINGITSRAQSANGCNCHGSSKTAGVVVTISGPQTVLPSSVHSYTVTVTGGPSAGGGFNLKASGGTLAAGANNWISGLDVTHLDNTSRSWTFSWTAPAATGTQNFYALGLAADQSGDETGDQWNWYGGAVNTAWPITVSNTADVGDVAGATWLAPASPNPLLTHADVTFSLASAGPASLDVLDAAGRRVATLASGVRASGRQSVRWNGRDDAGRPLGTGMYFIRLRAAGRTLTSRVMLMH